MIRIFSIAFAGLCAALPASALAQEKPKQLLMISFDGAHDNALWQKSRAMAARNEAHFTYFLSCTFLMNKDARKAYRAPGHAAGKSNVGFAQSDEEIRTRLNHIWQAHLEGHEIGSHACGHFDGQRWSEADWSQEFNSFRQTLEQAWTRVDLPEPEGWQTLVTSGIHGFRAPYLSAGSGPALVMAEKKAGFTYDASLVTKGPALPQDQDGILRFGLPLIPEGPQERPIVGMDYNLFVRHSKAKDDAAQSKAFEERTYTAFHKAFQNQYEGARIPLQLGFHFVEMNDGAYWRALDRLASDVCQKPDVACVSYSEAISMIKKRAPLETRSGL